MIAWPIIGSLSVAITLAVSVYFIVAAVRTFEITRHLPAEHNADDERIARSCLFFQASWDFAFSIIALWVANAYQWILPIIMIYVALHFFPMAKLFHRTIDYTLGTFMLVGAAIGFFILTQGHTWQVAWAIAGIIGAVITLSYGFNAVMSAGQVLTSYRRQKLRCDPGPTTVLNSLEYSRLAHSNAATSALVAMPKPMTIRRDFSS